MKRSGFKRKIGKPMKRTKLRVVGHSTTSELKAEIQSTLREIAILRDGKCILFGIKCGREYGDEGVVWQYEHFIERSNSETYGDSRLGALICRNCHFWKHLKKSNHDQYNEWVKRKIGNERTKLWERCEKDLWRPKRTSAMDWKLVLLGLKQELQELRNI